MSDFEINRLIHLLSNSNATKDEEKLKKVELCIAEYHQISLTIAEEINGMREKIAVKANVLAKMNIKKDQLSSAFEQIRHAMNDFDDTATKLKEVTNSFRTCIDDEANSTAKIIEELNEDISLGKTKLDSCKEEKTPLEEKLLMVEESYRNSMKTHETAMETIKNDLQEVQSKSLNLSKDIEEKEKNKEQQKKKLKNIEKSLSEKSEGNEKLKAQLIEKTIKLEKKKIDLAEKKKLFEEESNKYDTKIADIKLKILNQNQEIKQNSEELLSLGTLKSELINAIHIINQIPREKALRQTELLSLKTISNDKRHVLDQNQNVLNKESFILEEKRLTLKRLENKAELTDVTAKLKAAKEKLAEMKAQVISKREQLANAQENFNSKITRLETEKRSLEKTAADLSLENDKYTLEETKKYATKEETFNTLKDKYKIVRDDLHNLQVQCRVLKSSIAARNNPLQRQKRKLVVENNQTEDCDSSSQVTYNGEPVAKFNAESW